MKKYVYIIVMALVAQSCFAEVFEYTDKNGVIHFTDDPSNVPKEIRLKKTGTSSMSTEESQNLNAIMKASGINDFPLKSNSDYYKFKEFIRNASKNENFKNEFGDPDESIDPRLSTPEGALNLLMHGFKTGNLEDIKASLIGKLWREYSEAYKSLTKEQLKLFYDAMANFVVTRKEQRENFAVIYIKVRGLESPFEFINFFGKNWKIYHAAL